MSTTAVDAAWPVVAGIPIQAHAPPGTELRHWLLDGWGGVAREPAEAPIEIHYTIGNTSGAGLRTLVRSPEDETGSYLLDERGELAVRASAVPDAPPQLLLTRRSGREYELRYARRADLTTLQWKWPRNVFGYALASRQRGLVAHACGLRLATGEGVLVPGCSGEGKSTFGRTMAAARELGVLALSDDRIAVTEDADGEGPRLWGTPWYSSSHLAAAASAPLSLIAFPARGGATPRVRALSRTEAARRLLRTLGFPVWSAPLMLFALDFTTRLVAAAPAIEIAYTPAPDAASALHVHLCGAVNGRRDG